MHPDVLGRVAAQTHEDAFGPGDPLEVARLVRRALAAADRKALDVTDLIVVAEVAPSREALDRFTRRALGPHGTNVRADAHALPGADHASRERAAIVLARTADGGRGGIRVVVVLGPSARATVLCLA